MRVKSFEWRMGLVLVLVTLVGAGCGKKEDVAVADTGGEIVASVNGKVITKAEVDRLVDMQLATMRGRVPAEKLEEGRDRLAFAAVDQFVVKTLLLEEAERQGIAAPQDEIDAAIERIKGNMPEGKTLESLIAQNPRGETGLIEDITVGMKINKLLEQQLEKRLQVTDDEIAGFMAENAERLKRPERVRASHILVKTATEDDDAAKAAKKEKLEGIRAQILAGADFAELAKEHSACPSGQKGGDLDFFTRGRMAKPFEDAAFSQDVDTVGPVIETQFGYHIIKVTDKQAEGVATQDEVRDMLKRRKQDTVVREYIQSLRAGADIVVKGKPLPAE